MYFWSCSQIFPTTWLRDGVLSGAITLLWMAVFLTNFCLYELSPLYFWVVYVAVFGVVVARSCPSGRILKEFCSSQGDSSETDLTWRNLNMLCMPLIANQSKPTHAMGLASPCPRGQHQTQPAPGPLGVDCNRSQASSYCNSAVYKHVFCNRVQRWMASYETNIEYRKELYAALVVFSILDSEQKNYLLTSDLAPLAEWYLHVLYPTECNCTPDELDEALNMFGIELGHGSARQGYEDKNNQVQLC